MTAGKSRVCSLGMFSLGIGLAAVLLAPREAFALQPLSDFVRSARTRNFDAREQAAVVAQRHNEASQAWLKLAPVVTASGSYTHNEYPAVATIPIGSPALGQTESVTIMAQNQLDATFSATFPIVDIGAWERIGGARRTATAARAQANATGSTCSEPSRRPTSRWWRRKPSFGPRTSDVTLPRRTSTSSGHVPPPASRRSSISSVQPRSSRVRART